MRHLFPNFCSVSLNLQGDMPHPHLPKGMKDMAATWCEAKVNNAGNL